MPDISEAMSAWIALKRREGWVAEHLTFTWPDKQTEGAAFQLAYLPPAIALLFEHLESGCEYEVTIRRKDS